MSKYEAVPCPCGQKGCRSGNLRPVTHGQGVMELTTAQELAAKLNAYEAWQQDQRGDFEKLTQQLEDQHNCLSEFLFHRDEGLNELLETGSLTADWEGLKFELTLHVKLVS